MNQQRACGGLRVNDLVVDPGARVVWRDETRIDLPRLSFDLLLTLVEAAPDAVTTDQLMERVWQGVVVSPATIAKRVELLRHALGDEATEPRYIELVRGYGYRMAAKVEPLPAHESADSLSSAQPDQGASTVTAKPAHTKKALVKAALALALVATLAWLFYFPGPPVPERSVAVLPFQALSGEPENQWFADGLAEEIAHELARTGQLRVTGRSSAFAVGQSQEDTRAIGRTLGVANLLAGSVRQEGERIRVTTRLIDAEDGYQLWSEAFEAPVADTLALQRSIAQRVVQRFQLVQKAVSSTNAPSTFEDPQAYALYLQAVSLSPYPRGRNLAEAQTLIEEVVKRDPGFAPGWNRLAAIHGRRLFFDPEYPLTPPDSIRTIREAVERALAIDPTIGEAYANLAGLAWVFDQDMERAAGLLEQAVRLDPWNLDVLSMARDFAQAIGDLELSRDLGAYILRRDPLCESCRLQYAGTLECLGDLEGAKRELLVINGAEFKLSAAYSLGNLSLQSGDLAAASEYFDLEPNPMLQSLGKVMLAHQRGEHDTALRILEEIRRSAPPGVFPVDALAAAVIGEEDLAMERLNLDFANRFVFLQAFVCNRQLDPLRDRPDWSQLMLELGFNEDGSQAVAFSLPPLPD